MHILLAAFLLFFLPTPLEAATCTGCTVVDGGNGCQVNNSVTCGIRADGVCYQISNNSGYNIFVAAKESSGNWASFYNNLPSGVSKNSPVSCASIAAGYCQNASAGSDACGISCGMGSIPPNCTNTNSYCTGTPYTAMNGCGTCTGTLPPDCSDSGAYCSGVPYFSSNGCGSCSGTQAPVNATWGGYYATGTYQPHPSGTCSKTCGGGTIAAQRLYQRDCNNNQTCGGGTCPGSASPYWNDEGTVACNTQACAPVYVSWTSSEIPGGTPYVDGNIYMYHDSGAFVYWWPGAGVYSGGLEGETMTFTAMAGDLWPASGGSVVLTVKVNGVVVHSSTSTTLPAGPPTWTIMLSYSLVLDPANTYEYDVSTYYASTGCPNVWISDSPSSCYEERGGWCGGKDNFEKCVVGVCGTSDGTGCTLGSTRGRDWYPWMSHMPCANYAIGGYPHCSTTPRDSWYPCTPSQDCATVRANTCSPLTGMNCMDSCNNYCGTGEKTCGLPTGTPCGCTYSNSCSACEDAPWNTCASGQGVCGDSISCSPEPSCP